MAIQEHPFIAIVWLFTVPLLFINGALSNAEIQIGVLSLILLVYAILLLRKSAISKGLGPDRPTPWVVLFCSYLLVFRGAETHFEIPKYPTEAPVKTLKDVTLSVNGLRTNMVMKRVEELKGKPDVEDLHYFLVPQELNPGETALFLAWLRTEKKIDEHAELEARYAAAVTEPPKRNGKFYPIWEAPGEADKPPPKVVIVERLPDTDELQGALEDAGIQIPGPLEVLFLLAEPDRQSALYLFGHARPRWVYKSEGVSVAFNSAKPHVVELVAGNRLELGTRTWCEIGDVLIKLNHPGTPPQYEKNSPIKSIQTDFPVYRKELDNREVKFELMDGLIMSIWMGTQSGIAPKSP